MTDKESSTREKLLHLTQVTHDISRTLRAQREMLQQRQIVIAGDALTHLEGVYSDLAHLSEQSSSSEMEIEIEQLRALARTTELINSTLDLDPVLNDVIDTVVALTGAERGYIVLRDADSGEFQFRVARDAQQRDLTPDEFTISRSVINKVVETKTLIVVVDGPSGDFDSSKSFADMRLRSILCVPLLRKGVLTGVIYADNRQRSGLFDKHAQNLVQAFANQAAVAIENARLFESVTASLSEITVMRDLMENVFESIPSGVITTSANDLIVTFNAAAGHILDVPTTDVRGRHIVEVLPVPDERLEQALQHVRTEKVDHTLELDTVLQTRGLVNLSLKLSPLRDEANSEGVVIVLNDLTALKRHTSQMQTLERYLPRALVRNASAFDRSRLGGEEREISILSCDIRGFTAFSERLEPEELMQVINVYLTVSSNAIESQGGIIDKFMGDAAIGLYNTQLLEAQPNHAEKAVRAAVQMARDVEAKRAELPPRHHIRYGIGVHTGNAVLGNLGSERRKEFTAIGDLIQFAKVLQENALGGEVIISQETYDRVKDLVIVEKMVPRKLKDRDNFEVMYRVIGLNE